MKTFNYSFVERELLARVLYADFKAEEISRRDVLGYTRFRWGLISGRLSEAFDLNDFEEEFIANRAADLFEENFERVN